MLRIAAFDSGVGGLTAIAPLFRLGIPVEITYLGDLANLPYGTKSSKRIQHLTQKNLTWLLRKSPESKKRFDVCVIACNTASAHALRAAEKIAAQIKTPLVGVIKPGCASAVKTQRPRIVVLATAATVASHAYLKTLKKLGEHIPIIEKACPLFVPLVEDNLQQSPAAEWIIKNYLDETIHADDAAILGCTHYPFLVPTLKKIYPSVEWIDAGAALISDPTIQKIIQQAELKKSRSAKTSSLTVYFTDRSTSLSRLESFLHELHLERIPHRLKYVPAIV